MKTTVNSSAAPEMIDTHWERSHPALLRLHTDVPLSGRSLHNVCIQKQVSVSKDSQATGKTQTQHWSAVVKDLASQPDGVTMGAKLVWPQQ